MRRILLELDYEGQTYYVSNSAYSGNLVYYPFLISIPQIGIGGEGFAKVTTGQVVLSLNVDDPNHPFGGSRYYSLISNVQEIPFRLYLEEEDAPIFVGNLTLSEVTQEEIRFLVVEEKFETPLIYPVLDRDSRVEVENFYLFQPAGVTDAADWQVMVSAVNISLQDQEEMIFERFAASDSLNLLTDAFQELIYDKTKENSYLVAPSTALNKRIMLADKEDQSKIITVRDLGGDPEAVLQSMGYSVTTTTSGSDTIYQVNSTAITSSYTHTVDSVLIYGYQDLIGTDTTASIHKPPTQPTNKYNIGPPINNPFTFGEVSLRSPVIPYGDAKIKRDNQSFSVSGTVSFEPSSVTGSSSVSTDIQIFAEDLGQAGSPQSGGVTSVTYSTENLSTGYITQIQVEDLNTGNWISWQKDIPFRKIRFRVRETPTSSTTGLLEVYTGAPFENNIYGQDSTWPMVAGDTWNVLDLGSDSDIASRDFNDKAKYRTAGQTETQTWTRGASTSTGLEYNSWGFWNSGFAWPAAWSTTGLYQRSSSSPLSYWFRKRELDGTTIVQGVVDGNYWLNKTENSDHLNNWNNYNRTLHYYEGNFGDRLRRVERDPENSGTRQDLTKDYHTNASDFTTKTGFTVAEKNDTYMKQYFKYRSTGAARLMELSELINTGDYVRIDLMKRSLVYSTTVITGSVLGTDIDSISNTPYWGVKWGYIYRAFRGGVNSYYTWIPDGANPLTWQPVDSNYQKSLDTGYSTDGMIGWQGKDPYNSGITTYGENSLRWYKTGSRYYNNGEYIQGSDGNWLTGQDLSDIAEVQISAYFKLANEDYSAMEVDTGWFWKNEIYWKGVKIWEDPDYHLNDTYNELIPYKDRTIGSGNVPTDYIFGSTKIGSDTSTTTPDGVLHQRKRHLAIRLIHSQYFEIGHTEQVPSTTSGYGGIYIGTNSSNRVLIESSKVSGITKSDFTVNETYIDGDGITWSITLKTPEVYSTTFGTIEPDGSVTNQTAHRYDLLATRVLPAAWIYDPDNTYSEKFLESITKRLKALTYNSSSSYYEMTNEVDSVTGDAKVYWTSGPASMEQWKDAIVIGKEYKKHESTTAVVAEVAYIPITDEYRLENARTNIYKRAEEVWEADPDSHTGLGWSSISKKDEAYGVGWADGKSMTQSGSTTTENWYDFTASTKTLWEWTPDPASTITETKYNKNSGGLVLPEYHWKLRLETNGDVTLQITWNDVVIHTQTASVQPSSSSSIGAIHDAGEDLWNLTEVTLSDGSVIKRDPSSSGAKYWTNFPNAVSSQETVVNVEDPECVMTQYWVYNSDGSLNRIIQNVYIQLDGKNFSFNNHGAYTVSNVGTYKFIGFDIKKLQQGNWRNSTGTWGVSVDTIYSSKITLATPNEIYFEVSKSYTPTVITSGTLRLWVDGLVKESYTGTTTSWHYTKSLERNSTEYLLTRGTKQSSPSGDSNQYWQIDALNTEVSGYYLSQLYIENDVVYESNYKTPISLSNSSTLIDGKNTNLPQHLDIATITQSPNMGTITSDLYNLYRIDNSVAEPVPLGVLKIPANHTSNSVKPNIDIGTQTYTSGSKTFYETYSSIKVNDGSYRDWLEYDSDLQSVTITLRCYAGTRVHELNFYTYSGLTLNKIADTAGTYPDGTISRQVDGYNDMPIPNGTQIIGIKLRNDEDDVDDYAKRIRGCDLYIKQRFFPQMGRTAVGKKEYAYVFCAEILDIQSAYGIPVTRYAKQSHFMDLFKNGVTTGWPFDSATDEVSVYAIRNPNLQVGFTPLTTTDYLTANWTPRVFDDGVELGLKLDPSDSDPLSKIYIESSTNSDLIYLSHNPFGQVALTGKSANGSNIRDFFNYVAIKLKAEKEDPENRIGLVNLYFDDDVDYSMADEDVVLSYNLPIYTDSEMTIFEMAERVSKSTNHQFFMKYFLNPDDSKIYRKIYLVDINKSFTQDSSYRDLITQEIISINIEFPYPIKAFESTLSRNVSYRATLSQNYESIMKQISSTYRIDGSGIGNVQQHELFAESFEEGKKWLRRFAEVGHSPKVRIEYAGVDTDLKIGEKISFKDELRHLDGFLVVQELQYNFESDSTTVSGIGKFEEIIHS